MTPRASGKTKLGSKAVANVLWDTPITKPQGTSVPTWSRNAYKDSSLPNSTVSTPEELSAWLRDLAAKVVGNPKKRVQIKQEALVKKATTIYIEFCDTEIWTARKPRRVAIGPQEFVAPWHVAGPHWVTPSFTVIPAGIYPTNRTQIGYRSKNGLSRNEHFPSPWLNFCPTCFDEGEHDGKVIEKRKGKYVPQMHACMPEVYA
jgi:hypothetical protein